MKKEFIIGIDVSKGNHDACLLKFGTTNPIEEVKIKNNQGDIEEYFKRICSSIDKKKLLVCLEHTGHYGLVLCVIMQELGIDFTLVPALEIKNTQGITRGKTDKIDALRIATYAWRYFDKITLTVLPAHDLMLIKDLLTLRLQDVKISVQLQNSLKSHRIVSSVLHNNSVVVRIEKHLKAVKQEIKEIDKQLKQLISSNETLKTNYKLLNSIKGIGPLTATTLIATTQNFKRFSTARKFNSYTGLAPFKDESGKTTKGSKVSHLANKKMKVLLHNGVNSAINYDPELKLYYTRRIKEGKQKRSVLNAIACKLIYRAFAVINRQTPFVNLYQNKFA